MIFLFPVERWFHYVPLYVLMVVGWLYFVYIINRCFTVPLFFKNNKSRLAGISVILICIFITAYIASILWYVPKIYEYDKGITRLFPSMTQHRQAVWSLFVIVESFSFMVGLLSEANSLRLKSLELDDLRKRAEIDLYKAQVNPHFMFNTLNSLYGLFLTGNEKALESLEKYISMMKYVNLSSSYHSIKLKYEVDYLRQFVDLQSLRLNGKTKVILKIEIESEDLELPPMLLVTFVENCFKHGVSPEEESEIKINISEIDGILELNTSNRIFTGKRNGRQLGIDNCRKRLNLIYPNRHQLIINQTDSLFKVKLNINLKENEVRCHR